MRHLVHAWLDSVRGVTVVAARSEAERLQAEIESFTRQIEDLADPARLTARCAALEAEAKEKRAAHQMLEAQVARLRADVESRRKTAIAARLSRCAEVLDRRQAAADWEIVEQADWLLRERDPYSWAGWSPTTDPEEFRAALAGPPPLASVLAEEAVDMLRTVEAALANSAVLVERRRALAERSVALAAGIDAVRQDLGRRVVSGEAIEGMLLLTEPERYEQDMLKARRQDAEREIPRHLPFNVLAELSNGN